MATFSANKQAVERARRFDRVDQLVQRRYYAADLHGINWNELREHYRPEAVAAVDEDAWYVAVNTMLAALGDAHTRVERPESLRLGAAGTARLSREPLADDPPEIRRLVRDIAYVRFDSFDDATVSWLRHQAVSNRDAKGWIIDLRRNRGGLIKASRRAVGLFFPKRVSMGVVVWRDGKQSLERSMGRRGVIPETPVVLLIGPGSHSSAEVFAYVLKHHGRAVLVGETTAGEVLGARPYRLSDGGELFISETDFHCLEGGRLEGTGVEPDVVVPRLQFSALDIAGADDLQMTVALRLLTQ